MMIMTTIMFTMVDDDGQDHDKDDDDMLMDD